MLVGYSRTGTLVCSFSHTLLHRRCRYPYAIRSFNLQLYDLNLSIPHRR